MASTSPVEVVGHSGATTLPGLRVGAYGAAYVNMKTYTFTGTDTGVITATSTERSYTINGLSTNDIVLSFVTCTGWAGAGSLVGSARVSAANTLAVQYSQNGTSTTGIPGPFSGVLNTIQVITLASSTTT